MAVRGAPAIGVAAAFGLALTAMGHVGHDLQDFFTRLDLDAEMLLNARPTAVNLGWAVKRMLSLKVGARSVEGLRCDLVDEAERISLEDIETNRKMAQIGAQLITDGDVIVHHCNTGALAAVDWGTALGCIRYAHEQGKRIHILVDETRPRLQGARLTTWELDQYGISYQVICDGAAGYFLYRNEATKVMFGADRVTARGDIVNKSGTYMLALAANASHTPVICVFPTSTLDMDIEAGSDVPIELRSEQEVLGLQFEGQRVFPVKARAANPAFDVTPADLITQMVTEQGIIEAPFAGKLAKLRLKSVRELSS